MPLGLYFFLPINAFWNFPSFPFLFSMGNPLLREGAAVPPQLGVLMVRCLGGGEGGQLLRSALHAHKAMPPRQLLHAPTPSRCPPWVRSWWGARKVWGGGGRRARGGLCIEM